MVQISNSILQCRELDEILASVTRELSSLIDLDRSSVALRVPEEARLVLQHIYKKDGGATKYGEGREVPLDESSVIGWVAKHRESILRRDIEADNRFSEIVQEENLKSDIIVPLLARGKLVGTLNVGSFRKKAFSKSDLAIVENCGKLACVAIEHAMLLKEAQELGERYKTLQENANVVIVFVDRNTGKLVEVNRKCESVLGFKRGELLEKSYFDLFPKEDQYQARRDFINILSQNSNSFVDRRMVGKDGRIIYVEVNARLIKFKDDILIHAAIHDVSQRKMMEQQIILQNKNLQEINRRLREVDEMKTEFLARISHELRTPLSVILAYSESLRERDMTEEERQAFLDVIADQGQTLLDMINNLLELSNLEISGAMLNITLAHIHDVIRSVWPQVERSAKAKEISVSFHPGYEIPVAYFDNKRILQVVSCLIHNAIKFTGRDGSIEVRTSVKNEKICMEVADTGEGIPDEELPHIFEAFHQVDGSHSRRWGGLGIGLAVAKHIVELHGGEIIVESEYGRGSVFLFTLPLGADTDSLPVIYQGGDGVIVEDPPTETAESDASSAEHSQAGMSKPEELY